MPKTFIFGIDESVDGSAYLSTEELYNRTGANVGNLAFHYAISKILGDRPLATPWHTAPDIVNGFGDLGVMPCANQLGPHADYGGLGARFADLKIKLLAIGLGAQGNTDYDSLPIVPAGTLEWVRQIVAHAPSAAIPNIGVRGPFTLRVLEHNGFGEKAVVTGCPTLFINPDRKLGHRIKENLKRSPRRIAVAAGHQKWRHLAAIEASLTEMVTPLGGSYIVQSPIEMVRLARGEADLLDAETLEECRSHACPGLSIQQFKDWALAHARAFFNVSEWMEHLRAFDYVVGPRIHGVMLGLQAGVPSLCIAHDSRTRELCETLSVPFVLAKDVASGIKAADLPSLIKFDADAFAERRRDLATVLVRLMTGNGLPASAWLTRLLERESSAPIADVAHREALLRATRQKAAGADVTAAAGAWTEYRDAFDDDPTGYIEPAAMLQSVGRLDEAELLVARGIRLFPDHVGLASDYARLAFARRDFESTRERWEAVQHRFPASAAGYAGLAQLHRVFGNPEEAERVAAGGVANFPNDAALAIEFARAAAARRDVEESARRWADVRARFPGFMEGYAGGIQALRLTGRLDEADNLANIAAAKFPSSLDIARERARLRDLRQDWQASAREWMQIAVKHRDEVEPALRAGQALRHLHRAEEAVEVLRSAVARSPSAHELHVELLRSQADVGNWVEVIACARQLRAVRPEEADGWTLAANALRQIDRHHEADDLEAAFTASKNR